jgi:hypothetical protein
MFCLSTIVIFISVTTPPKNLDKFFASRSLRGHRGKSKKLNCRYITVLSEFSVARDGTARLRSSPNHGTKGLPEDVKGPSADHGLFVSEREPNLFAISRNCSNVGSNALNF